MGSAAQALAALEQDRYDVLFSDLVMPGGMDGLTLAREATGRWPEMRVLLASGYIAGGAIAGIVIAFLAGVLGGFDKWITDWATANNPFFEGPHADLLSLIPFAAIVIYLALVALEKVLVPRRS